MDINITCIIRHFLNDASPRDYSASVAELGRDAGSFTWNNAKEHARELFGEEFDRAAFDGHFAGFGAWDHEELAAHTDEECAALMLQLIAGDWREAVGLIESESDAEPLTAEWWEELEELSRSGTAPSNLGRGDDGAVYYYIGS